MIKKILLLMIILISHNISYAKNANKILFDEGHRQLFLISTEGQFQLSGLSNVLKEAGFEISTTKEAITEEILKDFQSLIISGPFKEISEKEIEEIYKFVSEGGNLVVMLHISPPAVGLFKKFGVLITRGSISENDNLINRERKIDFNVTNLSKHPLFENINKFSVYGSWGFMLENDTNSLIAKTSINSWIDINRNGIIDIDEPKGPFGIVATGKVGKGNFLFFADDGIFQNNFLKDENLTLARNLAKFLKFRF